MGLTVSHLDCTCDMHIWVLAYFLGYRGSYDGRAIDSSVLTDFMIHPSIFTVSPSPSVTTCRLEKKKKRNRNSQFWLKAVQYFALKLLLNILLQD